MERMLVDAPDLSSRLRYLRRRLAVLQDRIPAAWRAVDLLERDLLFQLR